MKKWAFIDCFEAINLDNIDFSDYEKIIFISKGDISIPLGSTHPSLEITVIYVEAFSQEQSNHALTFNLSKYHSVAKETVWFDVYSNYLSQTKVDDLLRGHERFCQFYELPPDETISLDQALDNLVAELNNFSDKRRRPRSVKVCLSYLNSEWRPLRGRISAIDILDEMDSRGMINYSVNGISFLI